MKTSSHKILTFLEKNSPATVEQIALAVDLTRADVRYQLRQLEGKGKLNRLPPTAPTSPGRPADLYSIKQQVPEAFYQIVITNLLENQDRTETFPQSIVRSLLGSASYSG